MQADACLATTLALLNFNESIRRVNMIILIGCSCEGSSCSGLRSSLVVWGCLTLSHGVNPNLFSHFVDRLHRLHASRFSSFLLALRARCIDIRRLYWVLIGVIVLRWFLNIKLQIIPQGVSCILQLSRLLIDLHGDVCAHCLSIGAKTILGCRIHSSWSLHRPGYDVWLLDLRCVVLWVTEAAVDRWIRLLTPDFASKVRAQVCETRADVRLANFMTLH